ncbi:MAG TPA: YceI family protein [Acidimicrobiia bacterium]|jgi:polyisoprenoid-binding protein YceI
MRRFLKIFLPILLVVIVGGGFAFYWFVVRSDAKPKATITATKVTPGGSPDGTWTLATGDGRSFVGYRVQEQFAVATVESTATGRTSDVTGTIRIAGTTVDGVSVKANLTTLTSDRPQRDRQIKSRGLQTNTFPEATFTQTAPATLPHVPGAGETIDVPVTGDLTLHGVTKRVTVAAQGRFDGRSVQVVAHVPIVFSDYRIEAPSIGGFVSVRDRGELELQLFFARGPAPSTPSS